MSGCKEKDWKYVPRRLAALSANKPVFAWASFFVAVFPIIFLVVLSTGIVDSPFNGPIGWAWLFIVAGPIGTVLSILSLVRREESFLNNYALFFNAFT
jgi:hypothetical protein